MQLFSWRRECGSNATWHGFDYARNAIRAQFRSAPVQVACPVDSKTPAGIILADDSIQEHFVQTSLGVIENFDWIELTPRYIEAQYDYIKIGFNKNKLGMMIIADNLGQTTRIDFSSVQKNTALSASFFNFDIPKNIDIFDERK